MEFRACCCLKPRTGAFLAGLVHLILGILGIIALICFNIGLLDVKMERDEEPTVSNGSVSVMTEAFPPIMTESPNPNNSTTDDFFDTSSLNLVTCLYTFEILFATLHGFLALLAAAKKNASLNHAALFVNVLLILGSVGGFVVAFILGYHWIDVILLPFAVVIQLYFLWVILDYQKYFSYTQPLNTKPRG